MRDGRTPTYVDSCRFVRKRAKSGLRVKLTICSCLGAVHPTKSNKMTTSFAMPLVLRRLSARDIIMDGVTGITNLYGPIGASLYPTPRLSNTSTEYLSDPSDVVTCEKCSTTGDHPKQVVFSLGENLVRRRRCKQSQLETLPYDENHLFRSVPVNLRMNGMSFVRQIVEQ